MTRPAMRTLIPSTKSVNEWVLSLRAAAQTENWKSISAERSVDDLLCAVSLLGYELKAVRAASQEVLDVSTRTYRFLSSLDWTENEVGERREILQLFAFLGWRHARALGHRAVANGWIDTYDSLLDDASASIASLEYFLAPRAAIPSKPLIESLLGDVEELFRLCSLLRFRRYEGPEKISAQLRRTYAWVQGSFSVDVFEDEKDYILGQLATSISVVSRWQGSREESSEWLGAASEHFRLTKDPETGSIETTLVGLVTEYEIGNSSKVLQELMSLKPRIEAAGLGTAMVKALILEAVALKRVDRPRDSVSRLQQALHLLDRREMPGLRAYVVEALGECYALLGDFGSANEQFASAFRELSGRDQPAAAAWLRLAIGEAFRLQGRLTSALEAYRSARSAYEEMAAVTWVAYARVLSAEALVVLGRGDEAVDEILKAMPILNLCSMHQEGIAAVALLRESIRQRNADPTVLKNLRDRLRSR